MPAFRRAAGPAPRPLAIAPPTLAAAYRHCRGVVVRARSNLGRAFWLLPSDQHRAMDALYAFARQADDLADEPGPLASRQAALAEFREQLTQALAGMPATPLLVALADTAARFALPREPLYDLLTGVAQDLAPQQPETWAELERYCHRVASSVGLACLAIWRADRPELHPPAIACGVALQLTNILRDLAEDFARGRCYLPRELLQRHGLQDVPWEAWPQTPASKALLSEVCERARREYAAASVMLPELPPAPRRLCRLMQTTYRELLETIAAAPERALRGRVALPWWRKLWLAGQVLAR